MRDTQHSGINGRDQAGQGKEGDRQQNEQGHGGISRVLGNVARSEWVRPGSSKIIGFPNGCLNIMDSSSRFDTSGSGTNHHVAMHCPT